MFFVCEMKDVLRTHGDGEVLQVGAVLRQKLLKAFCPRRCSEQQLNLELALRGSRNQLLTDEAERLLRRTNQEEEG